MVYSMAFREKRVCNRNPDSDQNGVGTAHWNNTLVLSSSQFVCLFYVPCIVAELTSDEAAEDWETFSSKLFHSWSTMFVSYYNSDEASYFHSRSLVEQFCEEAFEIKYYWGF